MQVGRRKLRRKLGANSNLTIGFAIYKVLDERTALYLKSFQLKFLTIDDVTYGLIINP